MKLISLVKCKVELIVVCEFRFMGSSDHPPFNIWKYSQNSHVQSPKTLVVALELQSKAKCGGGCGACRPASPNQDKKTLLSLLIRFQMVGYLPCRVAHFRLRSSSFHPRSVSDSPTDRMGYSPSSVFASTTSSILTLCLNVAQLLAELVCAFYRRQHRRSTGSVKKAASSASAVGQTKGHR